MIECAQRGDGPASAEGADRACGRSRRALRM